MPWYHGPTVIETLDEFAAATEATSLPLRFPIQDVFKFDHRRIIAGRIESGRLKVGDRLLFSPSGKTARVASIEAWNAKVPAVAAAAGQSIGVTLDEQVFIERGQIASHLIDAPLGTDVLRARLFWLGRAPLSAGRRYKMKLGTAEHMVTVETVERVIDVADLASIDTDWVEKNAVAEVVLRSRGKLALDEFVDNPKTGRFVLVDRFDIVGGGVISMQGFPDNRCKPESGGGDLTAVAHKVSMADRQLANRHRSGILWSPACRVRAESTIAMEVERRLFARGYQVFVLDGDNVRQGLNADLGFSPEDRAENVRRIGEVAHLFAQAGMVVIAAFISPYRTDRDRVRAAAPGLFHEIYVRAPLEECASRDPKGLYAKARQGGIGGFTGVSAPYEPPVAPELVVDTAALSVEEAVQLVLRYVEETCNATPPSLFRRGRTSLVRFRSVITASLRVPQILAADPPWMKISPSLRPRAKRGGKQSRVPWIAASLRSSLGRNSQ